MEVLVAFFGVFALTRLLNNAFPNGQPGVASLAALTAHWFLERGSSFRFAKSKIYLHQGRSEADFEYENLTVDGPESYRWNKTQYIVFWDGENSFFLNCHPNLFYLPVDTVWALVELEKRGANIQVAGFGRYEYPEPDEHIDKYKAALVPLNWLVVLSLLVSAGLVAAAFAGLLPFVNLLPLLLFIPIFMFTNHVQRKLIDNGEPMTASYWIEITEDEIHLYRHRKIAVQVKLEEVKTIFVTIEQRSFNRSKISIEVQTHYARCYKLLEAGKGLDFSQSLFLEEARNLGLHIVYRRIVKSSGEMVVIHEVGPSAQIMQYGETYDIELLSQYVQPFTEIKEEA